VIVRKSIDSRQARPRPPPVNGLAGKTWKHERRRPREAAGFGETRRSARAGRAFDPRRLSSALCNVNIVCEVIEGAGPNERRGDPEPGGKAERPGTAQRLNGDPQGPDPGNADEGRPPRRPFRFDRAASGHYPVLPGGMRHERRAGGGCRRSPYRGRLRGPAYPARPPHDQPRWPVPDHQPTTHRRTPAATNRFTQDPVPILVTGRLAVQINVPSTPDCFSANSWS
jgi:hypothetical protein